MDEFTPIADADRLDYLMSNSPPASFYDVVLRLLYEESIRFADSAAEKINHAPWSELISFRQTLENVTFLVEEWEGNRAKT